MISTVLSALPCHAGWVMADDGPSAGSGAGVVASSTKVAPALLFDDLIVYFFICVFLCMLAMCRVFQGV